MSKERTQRVAKRYGVPVVKSRVAITVATLLGTAVVGKAAYEKYGKSKDIAMKDIDIAYDKFVNMAFDEGVTANALIENLQRRRFNKQEIIRCRHI